MFNFSLMGDWILIFWLVGTILFSISQRLLKVIVFFRLVETVSIFSFFYFFVQTFFLLVEPSLKLVEEIVKEKHILTNVTDFLASRAHFLSFLRQQLTAACGNSSFFNWNMFFSRCFIPAIGNKLFVYWEQYCFIPSFFCWWKL